MDFEPPLYSTPHEDDVLRSVRGRIHYDSRFAPRPYARALAERHGPYDAPSAGQSTSIRYWYAALAILLMFVVFACMVLLLAMGSNSPR